MIRRFLISLISIFLISFFLPRMIPGDVLKAGVSFDGGSSGYSENQIERYKEYYNPDDPIIKQLFVSISHLMRGDLGYSIVSNKSVNKILSERVQWTLGITLASLTLSMVLGGILATKSVLTTSADQPTAFYKTGVILSEIPDYLLGIFLLLIFGGMFRLLPISGGLTSFHPFTSNAEKIVDVLKHAILPVATLSIPLSASFFLFYSEQMRIEQRKPYVRTAIAKGISKYRIVVYHILPNLVPQLIHRVLSIFNRLFSGTVLVEVIFQYPGIGLLLRESIYSRDYILIQSLILGLSLVSICSHFFSELVHNKILNREKA